MGLFLEQDLGEGTFIELQLLSYADTHVWLTMVDEYGHHARTSLTSQQVNTLIKNLQEIKEAMPND